MRGSTARQCAPSCGPSLTARTTSRKAIRPKSHLVNNTLDALRAVTNLSASIQPPSWLCDSTPDMTFEPTELICCRNGILHAPTGELLPATPDLFAVNSIDFAYDHEAPEPAQWLRFLGQLWPGDGDAIATLQEIFGYLLTQDNSQQKLFLVVGPKRSGKGTVARVLRGVVGTGNVVAPTLASLSLPFGLQPLVGKTVAVIADARLGARADQSQIAERLLSISGEDAQTVDRKFLPSWTGNLPVRFMLLTNELPRLADASGALASRFVVLTLRQSFYGREDPHLSARLLGELPGILNWSLAGLRRLRERGNFVQPASSLEVVEELEARGSPITAFLRDCGYIIVAGRRVAVDLIYADYREWCGREGRTQPTTKPNFGRELRAAVPGLQITRPREDGERVRFYEGLGK